MSKMSGSEYNDAKKYIQDYFQYGSGAREAYVGYLNRIIAAYDDGYECAQELDHYQTKWTVFGNDIR